MKKILLFLFTILLLPALSSAQITFQKTYGRDYDDAAEDIQPTSDGGYIVCGYTVYNGPPYEDIYVLKLNAIGDTLWSRIYSAYLDDFGLSIAPTTDGGYIMAVESNSTSQGGDNMGLIKIDSSGDVLWTKAYDGNGIDAGGVLRTNDGGYLLYGRNSGSGSFTHAFLIKTDALGDTLWSKVYTTGGSDEFGSAVQTTDGGFAFTGYSWTIAGQNYDMYVVKTDGIGNIQWSKAIGDTTDEIGRSIEQTSDGGFIIAGESAVFGPNNDAYLLKLDAQGNISWNKTYGGTWGDGAYCVHQTYDNGYILAGVTYSFGAGTKDIYLIKTNVSGDTLWTKTFGGSNNDEVSSIHQTIDGGYILAGYTENFGNGYASCYIIKTNSSGNTNCFQLGTPTVVGSTLVVSVDRTTTSSSQCLVLADSFTVSSGANINTVCGPQSGLFRGKVFWDQNQDGILNAGDTPLAYQFVSQLPDPYSSSTSLLGDYALIFMDSATQYSITYQVPNYWQLTTASLYTVTPQFDSTSNLNFGIVPTPNINDLVVTASSGGVSPGRFADQWINYSNVGTTVLSGTVSYKLDSQLTFISSIPIPDMIVGDSLIWNFSNLQPFNFNVISLHTLVSGSAISGDSVECYAHIEPVSTDSTPENNSYVLNKLITVPIDPNAKDVTPRGSGSNHCIVGTENLDYTIRFQNTGTDTAFNITVRDTLDLNINPTSFHLISSSHFVQVTITEGKYLAFTFPNILLPDSNVNEQGSHGFVKYSVKPVANLPLSTVLNNSASIYFDFNSAVKTNTAFSTICSPLGIDKPVLTEDLSLFPNPTSSSFFIESQSNNISAITIHDVLGREVLSLHNLNEKKLSVPLTGFSSGIYLVNIKTSKGEVVKKVVVE